MEKSFIEKWFCSRTIKEKERIAGKIMHREVFYPECTDVWNNLDDETKVKIYEHCSGDHGQIQEDWVDGAPLT